MYLIVGLGNPDNKYKFTRHNLGFRVLDLLGETTLTAWEEKHHSQFLKLQDVILAKPLTYMNNSGEAVKDILKYYPDSKLIVIQDELDLPLGAIKIQKNISAAGHNGIKSIIDEIGTQDFIRIRLGIDNPELRKDIPSEAFVLQKFSEKEEPIVAQVLESAKTAVETIQTDGFEIAQSKFNG